MKEKIFLLITVAAVLSLQGQEDKNVAETQPTKTKIEVFLGTGAVTIEGSAKVGVVVVGRVGGDGEVDVECKESISPNDGKRQLFLCVTVHSVGFGPIMNANIECDEAGSLVKGIDYLLSLNKSVTRLESFVATYVTKSGLKVVITDESRGGTILIGDAILQLTEESLNQFKQLIIKGKDRLNGIMK